MVSLDEGESIESGVSFNTGTNEPMVLRAKFNGSMFGRVLDLFGPYVPSYNVYRTSVLERLSLQTSVLQLAELENRYRPAMGWLPEYCST